MSDRLLVVDASVAIKWIVPEEDSETAESLLGVYRLIAPHLIFAECANILWKKVRRHEMSAAEVMKSATFVDEFAVHTVSMTELVPLAVDLSLRLDHAAYDCFYLSLAMLQDCRFVTADQKLFRKLRERLPASHAERCVPLDIFAKSQ